MTSRADRELETILRAKPLRKAGPVRPPSRELSALSATEQSNLHAKEDFDARIEAAGLGDHSIRRLAFFFGVSRSMLFERMCRRRTDLAPLPEWFQKLDDYIEFHRLYEIFVRSA